MRLSGFIFLVLSLAASIHRYAWAQAELVLEGLHPVSSTIFVAVHDNAKSFNEQGGTPVKQLKVPHQSGNSAVIPIPDLKPGAYAFLVFQDENGNKQLDRNLLGIPTEPYGYSGKSGVIPGPPSFEKSVVTVKPQDGKPAVVRISMR
jgi:uncharacterized protein (DUF2141 family)